MVEKKVSKIFQLLNFMEELNRNVHSNQSVTDLVENCVMPFNGKKNEKIHKISSLMLFFNFLTWDRCSIVLPDPCAVLCTSHFLLFSYLHRLS